MCGTQRAYPESMPRSSTIVSASAPIKPRAFAYLDQFVALRQDTAVKVIFWIAQIAQFTVPTVKLQRTLSIISLK